MEGALASLAGFRITGAALSGFQALVGTRGGDPVGPFGPYTDSIAPRFATAALLAALTERRRTGRGTWLDVAQVEAGLQFLAPEFCDYFAMGYVATANGNRVPDMAPHEVFACSGGDRRTIGRGVGAARFAGRWGGEARKLRVHRGTQGSGGQA